jgi:pimeloyl-ACP methyl ester carboxylesterase
MSITASFEERTVETWNRKIRLRFKVCGQGPALVYLHPAGGLFWDDFLTELARTHTVYAPEFPGLNPADTFAVHHLDDIFDVVLAYEEALRDLGLKGAPVVGQSFGGMLAAELSSTFTDLFSKVVLLAPAGLWNETHPWTLDFMSAPPESIPGMLFADPEAPRAKGMFAPPVDATQGVEQAVNAIWTFGCVAKFLWPIPDRGLVKRLNRVTAPTLVVWGEDDKLIPVAYAHEYGRRVAGSRVEILQNCGHIPQIEHMETTLRLVSEFLA